MASEAARRISYVEPLDPWYKKALISGFELASGRRRVEAIYSRLKAECDAGPGMFGKALELGRISVEADPGRVAEVPRDGPLIFLANHPYGVVDGLAMCDLAARTRGDFKILLHARLCRDADFDPYFLPVSFEDTRESTRINIATKRAALEVLCNGGTIVIFPSGAVSTRGRLGFGPLEDWPWSTFVAKIVTQSCATVVPVFIHGENSFPFHFVSGFSETLRTALLIREAVNRIGKPVRMDIGAPIPFVELSNCGSRRELTEYLRGVTFALAVESRSNIH